MKRMVPFILHMLLFCQPTLCVKNDQKALLKQPDDCSICQDPLIKKLTKTSCNHLYHDACLKKWALKCPTNPVTCPLCRGDLIIEKKSSAWELFVAFFCCTKVYD